MPTKSIYLNRPASDVELKAQTFRGSLGELRKFLSRYPDETPLGEPIEVLLKNIGVSGKPRDNQNECLIIGESVFEEDEQELILEEEDEGDEDIENEDFVEDDDE